MPGHPRPRGRIRAAAMTAVVTLLAAGLATVSATAPAVASGTPVTVVFQGSGTYTIDQHYTANGGDCSSHDVGTLSWSASFSTTLDGTTLASGPGELNAAVGPGTLAVTFSGTCTASPVIGTGCTASLSPGAASSPPGLSVTGQDPEHLSAQSFTAGFTISGCTSGQNAFVGSDVSVLNASLPDSLTALTDAPAASLASGASFPVSSTGAPGTVAASCLGVGQHGTGNDSCSASLTWSGSISIACQGTAIGTVTRTWGGGPALGSRVCEGNALRTGAGQRLEVTLDDGSVIRLGESSEATPSAYSPDSHLTLDFVIGTVWSAIQGATGHTYEINDGDRDADGVRGSAFTLSRPTSSATSVLHVIAGAGSYRIAGTSTTRPLAPGYSLSVTSARHASVSTTWPSADEALVPVAQRPPVLSNVAVAAVTRPSIGFTLNRSAGVTATLYAGTRRIQRLHATESAGSHRLRFAAVPQGHYAIVLSAADSEGRTRVVRRTFQVG